MSRDPSVARKLWQRLELVHAVTYFAPEAIGALRDVGYRGFWMGYFAGRAAPLGAAGPQVVGALFYNFAPSRVSRALPDAWGFAPPEAALAARLQGSVAALRRSFGAAAGGRDVGAAAELAARAASSAPPDGRALYAANRGLPWPDEPLAVLWHAATLLREHRGDGHVATLTAAGLSGREANVVQAAAGITPRHVLTTARDYDDVEWEALVSELARRGVLTVDGKLTPVGEGLKADIERRTDVIALSAYEVLDGDEIERLTAALTPLARAVLDSGDVPALTPIGVSLNS
jgi:Helix-turn-helix family